MGLLANKSALVSVLKTKLEPAVRLISELHVSQEYVELDTFFIHVGRGMDQIYMDKKYASGHTYIRLDHIISKSKFDFKTWLGHGSSVLLLLLELMYI